MSDIKKNLFTTKHAEDNKGNPVPIDAETLEQLKRLHTDAQGDLGRFKANLEDWFNETMDRTVGWYKKQTQIILFLVGIVVAVAFNIDAIAVYKILIVDKRLRDNMVQLAVSTQSNYQKMRNDGTIPKSIADTGHVADTILQNTYHSLQNEARGVSSMLGLGRPYSDTLHNEKIILDTVEYFDKAGAENMTDSTKQAAELIAIGKINLRRISKDSLAKILVIKKNVLANLTTLAAQRYSIDSALRHWEGYDIRVKWIKANRRYFQYTPNQTGGVETIIGWLITAIAISLGAPFWFDLLNKLMLLRSSGAKPDDPGNTTAPSGPGSVPSTQRVG